MSSGGQSENGGEPGGVGPEGSPPPISPVTTDDAVAGSKPDPGNVSAASARDKGARNLALLMLGVVLCLASLYVTIAVQASAWSPTTYANSADSTTGAESRPVQPLPSANDPDAAGRALFRQSGCATCHGVNGAGGVTNPNYLAGTFPQLNLEAERMQLLDPDEAAAVQEILRSGRGLDQVASLPVRRAGVVLAQYLAIRDIIRDGHAAGPQDPSGPPPIDMPAWGQRLTDRQINLILSFLLGQYAWEDDDTGD